ncbi:hypothetical protein AACT_1071 [Arcobacter acticola]|uniref:Uncharacterized protein n=1 Tax=Arcobacter acticola TaxID=1849015 RepID=A0A6M8EMR7_9BACT|nr:hypothetical protein [Arcobacter acticola]QKE28261.1 hypothetical protein AACT_1071 [Arcobacter acticola]
MNISQLKKITILEDHKQYKFTVLFKDLTALKNVDLEDSLNTLIAYYEIEEDVYWDEICIYQITNEEELSLKKKGFKEPCIISKYKNEIVKLT